MSPKAKKLARIMIVLSELAYLIFEMIPLSLDEWAEQSSNGQEWKGSLYKITSSNIGKEGSTYDDAEDHFCYSDDYNYWNTALCNTFRDMSYAEDVFLVFSIISIIFTFCWIILTIKYFCKPTVGVKLGNRGLSILNMLSYLIAYGTWLATSEATYEGSCDVNFNSQNRDNICGKSASKMALFTTVYGVVLAIVYNILINVLPDTVDQTQKNENNTTHASYTPIYSQPVPAQPIYSTYANLNYPSNFRATYSGQTLEAQYSHESIAAPQGYKYQSPDYLKV